MLAKPKSLLKRLLASMAAFSIIVPSLVFVAPVASALSVGSESSVISFTNQDDGYTVQDMEANGTSLHVVSFREHNPGGGDQTDLYYHNYNGSTWTHVELETNGDFSSASLELDSTGKPYIIYMEWAGGELDGTDVHYYASNSTSPTSKATNWNKTQVVLNGSTGSGHLDFAFLSNDDPFIVTCHDTDNEGGGDQVFPVAYWTWDDESTSPDAEPAGIVAEGQSDYDCASASVEITATDEIHIATVGIPSDKTIDYFISTNGGSSWTASNNIATLANINNHANIDLELATTGIPMILALDDTAASTDNIVFGYKYQGSWSFQNTVKSGTGIGYQLMDLYVDGYNPYITYYDNANDDLVIMYADNPQGGWNNWSSNTTIVGNNLNLEAGSSHDGYAVLDSDGTNLVLATSYFTDDTVDLTSEFSTFTISSLAAQPEMGGGYDSYDSTDVGNMSTGEINGMSTSEVAQIPASAWAGLVSSQIDDLSCDQLRSMSSSQVSNIAAATMSGLTASQVRCIDGGAFSNLTAGHITNMPTTSRERLKRKQIRNLPDAAFTAANVDDFDDSGIREMAASQLDTLISDSLDLSQDLSQEQMEAFRSEQLVRFDTVGEVTTHIDFLISLGEDQISGISPTYLTNLVAEAGPLGQASNIDRYSGGSLRVYDAAGTRRDTGGTATTDPFIEATIKNVVGAEEFDVASRLESVGDTSGYLGFVGLTGDNQRQALTSGDGWGDYCSVIAYDTKRPEFDADMNFDPYSYGDVVLDLDATEFSYDAGNIVLDASHNLVDHTAGTVTIYARNYYYTVSTSESWVSYDGGQNEVTLSEGSIVSYDGGENTASIDISNAESNGMTTAEYYGVGYPNNQQPEFNDDVYFYVQGAGDIVFEIDSDDASSYFWLDDNDDIVVDINYDFVEYDAAMQTVTFYLEERYVTIPTSKSWLTYDGVEETVTLDTSEVFISYDGSRGRLGIGGIGGGSTENFYTDSTDWPHFNNIKHLNIPLCGTVDENTTCNVHESATEFGDMGGSATYEYNVEDIINGTVTPLGYEGKVYNATDGIEYNNISEIEEGDYPVCRVATRGSGGEGGGGGGEVPEFSTYVYLITLMAGMYFMKSRLPEIMHTGKSLIVAFKHILRRRRKLAAAKSIVHRILGIFR